jgi:hypothetical protein
MHIVMDFRSYGVKIISYAEMENLHTAVGRKKARLWFFSSQQHLEEILAQNKAFGCGFILRNFMHQLPKRSNDEMVMFESHLASTIGPLVLNLSQDHLHLPLDNVWPAPIVVIDPPREQVRREGIFMWAETSWRHHVAILHSKEQAREMAQQVRDQLSETEYQQLQAQIIRWSATKDSLRPREMISGQVGELIYWAGRHAQNKATNARHAS